ncbi:class I SAM-dependent methyltransferase [Sphingomonas sp. Root710]|uniref:class I SAM-dependent methyltransferase n=1 Tax=Sphingomonas sp. Root710 TaxID=1736594 RepID=UPI0009EBA13A|nr:class I SAM-dependent methyltransferase [Sphingomonas sp. Root710]
MGGFQTYLGIPVLIDFSSDTLCRSEAYVEVSPQQKFYLSRYSNKFARLIRRIVGGSNKLTIANCERFILELKKGSHSPRVLIIGSGEMGQGTDILWADNSVQRVGIDIYPSETTTFVADAHQLPFLEGSFDGVWIQAVLEHVAEPLRVAAEIDRVLKDGGIVYSETPFMQQVHEGAYDFQRFTVTGHRFLFRRFETLAIGGLGGPGVVLAWAIRYFIWGLFRNRSLATIVFYSFLLWLRFFDRATDQRALWDGPSGTFFLGRKNDANFLTQRALPTLYRGFQV